MHKRYVREWNLPAFTKRIGVGFIIIGAGEIIGNILMMITGSAYCFLIYMIALIIGGFRIVSAIFKYNNK